MRGNQFPILKRKIHGYRLVYLDNAATTQKPHLVIETISNYYKRHNANIHRGIHTLSVEATNLYEATRDKIQKFLNAKSREEIIFTSGATGSINLVVWTWGQENIHRDDEILLTEMEHHSNLVPWQILAQKKGAKLKFISLNSTGRLDVRKLDKLISKRAKIVALAHVSNVLGVVNPLEKIIKMAHRKGAVVLVDGAQASGHLPIDVQKLDCDFYALSGHKMYGPTGVGVLYGKKTLLEQMPPYKTGGHMIKRVGWTTHEWNDLPWKYEAGTANIAEVIGLGAAIDFLTRIGFSAILSHESRITDYALKQLQKIPGLTIYGPKDNHDRIGVISFNLKGIPAHDVASVLDEKGIAIRTGHHCAMPLHQKLGIPSSARASFAIYNTKQDVDKLLAGLFYAKNLLGEN